MSMPAPPGYQPPGQGTAGATDVVTQLQGIVRQLAAWVKAFQGRITLGTFTFGAAATTVVAQTAVEANSFITLTALNAAAATLVGSAKSPYISAKSPGVSFTVATASGIAAAGTELFGYSINTPT
jgi:hypothetical protein